MALAFVVGAFLWLFLFQAQGALAISKISAVGSKFFNEKGDQFFVKGETNLLQ